MSASMPSSWARGSVVRVLYVVVSIVSVAFPGILCYLVLWIVMPKEPRA